ncbi:MAG: efflux RND transporter periplasmic adaptor subunit [Fuerstiella sp.]
MTTATVKPPNGTEALEKARAAQITVRSDLHFSRQVYQGQPVYVVHDPITFRAHRLTVFQYRVLTALQSGQSLGENFQRQVLNSNFDQTGEQSFYDLVASFARLGLAITPGSSAARLYDQHLRLKAMKRRGRMLSVLFLKIPLVNPDRFLQRTQHLVAWMFTKSFALIWLLLIGLSASVVMARFDEIWQPLNGMLATRNLPFLWLSFVLLKIWHELGHGYACKVFGGYVPEMGTVLIAGTPAAFVDASSAWSFPQRWKRLVVMCGGMFFESLVFIPCVFIWGFSSDPFWKSCAYQLVVMASVVTFFFNANPLMKFDGYFILSELIGIQNLRPRADARIKSLLAQYVVGVSTQPSRDSRRVQSMLIAYGISATIYKFFLVISIAMVVAIKFPMVGLALAVFHVALTVGGGAYRMMKYLLTSKETKPVRGRARLVAAGVLVGLPLLSLVLPVPFGIVTEGIVAADSEFFLNADAAGEFDQAFVPPGTTVDTATPLLALQNRRLQEQLSIARANLDDSIQRRQVLELLDPAEARRQQAEVQEWQQQVAELQHRVDALSVTSPSAGVVVRLPRSHDRGTFFREGDPLAVVVDGEPVVRTWLNEDQIGSIEQAVGTTVSFLVPGDSVQSFEGTIRSVQPAATESFDQTALTYVTGGRIVVDPVTGRPTEPLFQVDIEPANDSALGLRQHGRRVHLRLPRRYESVAAWASRKCLRFVQELLAV